MSANDDDNSDDEVSINLEDLDELDRLALTTPMAKWPLESVIKWLERRWSQQDDDDPR